MKRVKKNRWLLLLIIVLGLLILTACNGKGTGDDEAANVNPVANQTKSNTIQDAADGSGVADVKAPDKDSPDSKEAADTVISAASPEEKQTSVNLPDKKSGASKTPKQPVTSGSSGNKVTLWMTRDFGRNPILNKTVTLPKNCTVFDLLETSARVTTAHGGGFIESINGIESETGGLGGKKQDWFYYVNGVFADVGALDYNLQPGEIVWWDYHGWEGMTVFPAVIGCYPEPFVHGYRDKVSPATIMSSSENKKLAGDLQKALKAKGVASVNVLNLKADLMKNRPGPTIVLGQWSELSKIEWLADLNKSYAKNGTCVHFTDSGVELLDYKGQATRTINRRAGVIAATGTGSGDEKPLWLIIGTDSEGLQQAVKVLVNSPGKISGLYNAAILAGEVINLPAQ